MRQKILFTGGSGLLALNWAMAIRDRHTVILGLHEREIALAGVRGIKIDLESVDGLIAALEKIRPQIVVNTASLTSVETCEAVPDLAQHVNVDLAANVAQACATLGIQLVHISTDHLFVGKESWVSEAYPVKPVNVYGLTKAEAEQRVLNAYPEALVIRTNFYGWGTGYRHSFSDVIIASLRANKELILFQDVFYTPILIEVLVRAVHDLLELKAHGVFNVAADERISKYEFGLRVAQEFKLDSALIKPGKIIDQVVLVRRPHDMSISNQKICHLLGRKLGSVGEQISRLHQQEKSGLAQELQKL